MSKHFSFPEIPKVTKIELEKAWDEDYAISIAIDTLRCLSIAMATIVSMDESNEDFNKNTSSVRWRMVLGHISKTIKLSFSVIDLANSKRHREGINQLALQIADVCIQGLWLSKTTDENIEIYISNSLVNEKENYDRMQKLGSEEQKKYINKHFPDMFKKAGLDINTFNPTYRERPTLDQMFDEIKLTSKHHAIYDVLGFHQNSTSYMDIMSFYIDEHESKYRASIDQDPPKPYYISGVCIFLCDLIKKYVDMTFTLPDVKEEFNQYFASYESWVNEFNEFTMLRPFNKPVNIEEKAAKKGVIEANISAHKRLKKELITPFNQIDKLTFNSWFHDRMPDILWALCLLHGIGRAHSLDVFRKIIKIFMDKKDSFGEVTFSAIASLDKETRDKIFEVFKTTPNAITCLSNLKVVASIPGLDQWPLEEIKDSNKSWNFLAQSMFLGVDHQSQEATDCRWLKVACKVAAGKLHLGEKRHYEEIFYYPDFGDQTSVRPFIRASEISEGAMFEGNPEDQNTWMQSFWDQCFKNTECYPFEEPIPTQKIQPASLSPKVLRKLFYDMQRAYMKTIPNTRADAKHEVFWGLSLYATGLSMQILDSSDDDVLGVLGLRSVAESLINLNYLIKKNDPELWLRFRDYGVGKAKLTLLKAESDQDSPHYIDIKQLKLISNEDKWQEFVNIDLGDWSGENLRERAVNYGCKETYDNYYEWPSSFSHGQWSGIRCLVFGNCINPLHRFHRMPKPPGMIRTVRYDLEKLLNNVLELVVKEFPNENLSSSLNTVLSSLQEERS